jgi:hypothetical protein
MSYESAERVLHKAVISKTSFNIFKVIVLRELCNAYGLQIISTRLAGGTPKKDDFIAGLFKFVRSHLREYLRHH